MKEHAPNQAAVSARELRRRAALFSAGLALATSAIVLVLAAREAWPVARELVRARGSGWIALGFLLVSLAVTPSARIARRAGFALRGAGVVRRSFGLTAAACALAHALVAFGGNLAWDARALVSFPHLRAGLVALCVLLLLLATSFASVVARLRLTFFKELHRLAYVAALFVLAHLMLAPYAPRTLTLGLYLATCVFGLARFL